MQENLAHIIESLLFVSEEPLTIDKFKQILETVEAKDIRTALQDLSLEYQERGGGFKLAEVAGGWQLRSRPEFNPWIKRMLQPSPQRLSKAALETLAIVAYNQPIIRADIEHIRGVDCGGVLRQLLERKLIRVLGRKEIPGRPLIYATTKLFLELFELKDLKDLPSPREIEEMSQTAPEGDGTLEREKGAPDILDDMEDEALPPEIISDVPSAAGIHNPQNPGLDTQPSAQNTDDKLVNTGWTPGYLGRGIYRKRSRLPGQQPRISTHKSQIPDSGGSNKI